MQTVFKAIILCFLIVISMSANASTEPSSWYSLNNEHVKLRVDLFLSSTCPHCQHADKFFQSLEKENNLEVHRYIINKDRAALEKFSNTLKEFDSYDFSVPAIFFCNTHWIGVGGDGKQLIEALNYCGKQIEQTGKLLPAAETRLAQLASASWYKQRLVVNTDSKFFVPLMALLAALTPAAVFSILCLYAFLILIGKSKKDWAKIILIFILGSGIVLWILQTNSAFYYKSFTYLRFIVAAVGLSLLAFLYLNRLTKSKQMFLCLIATFIAVQAYQQLYTPNFALIVSQWLDSQKISALEFVSFKLFFQICYVLVIILIASALAYSSKLYAAWSKRSKIVPAFARYYLILLSLILIIYPNLLGQLFISYIVIFIALFASWIRARKKI